MHFYTFVDITPQLFNDKLTSIPGIDYVYTDKTGTVVKKENMGNEKESITDISVKTVHLILEKGNQLYDAVLFSYHNIDEDNCSLQTMRDKLITVLEGRGHSITDDTMAFENFDNDIESESDGDSDSDTKASFVKSLPITKSSSRPLSALSIPRTGETARQPLFSKEGQLGWDTSSRPLSATSAQSTPRLSKVEMDKLLDPSNLPEKTSKSTSTNKIAVDFALRYNHGTKPDDRVNALKNVKKEDQSAVLQLFIDQEGPKGKGGLPPRSIVESHFNHFNHLANEGSRPDSVSSQQTLIGRRALVYDAGSYKIGIIGPYKKSDDPDDPSKPDTYFIDVPNKSGTFNITEGMFENKDKKPKSFRDGYYSPVHRVLNKPRNNIYVLKKDALTELRKLVDSGRTRGGKKTKKVHPAKKNITRSKRR